MLGAEGPVATASQLLSTLSLASAWSAALIGAVAVALVGPPLAMGATIWLGNTEPVEPVLAYPWLLLLLLVLAGGLLTRHPKGAVPAHALAIVAALLPFWQLYRLWRLADGG